MVVDAGAERVVSLAEIDPDGTSVDADVVVAAAAPDGGVVCFVEFAVAIVDEEVVVSRAAVHGDGADGGAVEEPFLGGIEVSDPEAGGVAAGPG